VHDPLNPLDIASDELTQRSESGFDVSGIEAELRDAPADDVARIEAIYDELLHTTRGPDWNFDEPEGLTSIVESWPEPSGRDDPGRPVDPGRILGSWLGRVAGCNLGKPVEEGTIWTSERIREYLELAGSYPLRNYIPALDPMPAGFILRENWPHTTLGRVDGSDRDDDIDYAILSLHLLEQNGRDLSTRHVADGWLAFLPYTRVYTAERATYVNLLHNVPVSDTGMHRNPYREWIGAVIRGDAFGWVNPGRPRAAARHAHQDAVLSHRANGVYGEMWAAALVSAALTAESAAEAITMSLAVIPVQSRLAEAVHTVRTLHELGTTWEDALSVIQDRYGHYSWVHTVNNAAIITAGLLWGEDDFSTAVGTTVQGGWDTDSNGATVGSVMGALHGAAALPGHFIQPLRDRTRSAVFGYDHSRISDLAARTVALAARLE